MFESYQVHQRGHLRTDSQFYFVGAVFKNERVNIRVNRSAENTAPCLLTSILFAILKLEILA